MKRKIGLTIGLFAVIVVVIIMASSYYMLEYALAPGEERRDTAAAFRQLYQNYPETKPWVDSLRARGALRDTFVVMATGERHHAYYINKGAKRTVLLIHGWRDSATKFLYLAKMYERELGYNVVAPDLHAHGRSEGMMIQMGWKDRKDMLEWLSIFRTDTMVVHGVSMGAVTTMMLSAEKMPDGVRDIRFVEDCGYTSVWDEFAGELKNQFGLPTFPLLYTSSWLCKILNGWSFTEASAIEQLKQSTRPMLFIHGDSDTFVPTEMVYRLYEAKRNNKRLWITKDTEHARSYHNHAKEYLDQVSSFLKKEGMVHFSREPLFYPTFITPETENRVEGM